MGQCFLHWAVENEGDNHSLMDSFLELLPVDGVLNVMKNKDWCGETPLSKAFKVKSNETAFTLLTFLTNNYTDHQAGNLEALTEVET